MASFSPLQSLDFSRAETLITVISMLWSLAFHLPWRAHGCLLAASQRHTGKTRIHLDRACESILALVLQEHYGLVGRTRFWRYLSLDSNASAVTLWERELRQVTELHFSAYKVGLVKATFQVCFKQQIRGICRSSTAKCTHVC